MNEEKQIKQYNRPRGCFPDTKEGWDTYNAQFENKAHQDIWEDDLREKAMDSQHYFRESLSNMIDDMSVKESGL